MKLFSGQQHHIASIIGMSLLVAFVLSVPMSGRFLTSHYNASLINTDAITLLGYLSIFIGALAAIPIIKRPTQARNFLTVFVLIAFVSTIPLFFNGTSFWFLSILFTGISSGFLLSITGYYFKEFTSEDRYLDTVALFLVFTAVFNLILQLLARQFNITLGLILALFYLIVGKSILTTLPVNNDDEWDVESEVSHQPSDTRPLTSLILFIVIANIMAEFLPQVMLPAFSDLSDLSSWFYIIPYTLTVLIIKKISFKNKHHIAVYTGDVFIAVGFLLFLYLPNTLVVFLLLSVLIRSSLGIFDLFAMITLTFMFKRINNPIKIFGIGNAALVTGFFLGYLLSRGILYLDLAQADITVVTLGIVIILLLLLPIVKRQLAQLINDDTVEAPVKTISASFKPQEPLTPRETELLELILKGKSNKEIADELFISESTVKSHTHNIFNKYDVKRRSELMSRIFESSDEYVNSTKV